MRPTLPTYPEQLPALEGFQAPGAVPELAGYADIADVLETAERRGVVDAPAADKEAALRGDANLVRERIIAERLWLLGYLEDADDLASSRRNAERRRFLRAVADFQRVISGKGCRYRHWPGRPGCDSGPWA